MRKPSSPRAGVPARDDRGFTLVELIVAIVILAIVFVPLLHAFVTGAQTEAKSRIQNNATTAAQAIIENIQATDTATLLSSGSYVAEKVNNNATGVYTRSESNVSSNSSVFDTKVTLTPVSAVNDKAVVVSNSMDGLIDMTGADTDALNAFYNACNGSVPITATGGAYCLSNVITRTINITSVQKDATSYDITVNFDYGGTANYTTSYTDPDTQKVTYTQHSVPLNYNSEDRISASLPSSDAALARVNKNGGPAYSLYIYFKPIVHSDARTYYNDNISIFNTVGSGVTANKLDFNVFLIDTTDTAATSNIENVNYLPVINYYGQHNLDQARVFSNVKMTANTSFLRGYTAHTNVDPSTAGRSRTINFDGTLVEKQKLNRMYDIKVEVFRSGTTDPIITMNADKLG